MPRDLFFILESLLWTLCHCRSSRMIFDSILLVGSDNLTIYLLLQSQSCLLAETIRIFHDSNSTDFPSGIIDDEGGWAIILHGCSQLCHGRYRAVWDKQWLGDGTHVAVSFNLSSIVTGEINNSQPSPFFANQKSTSCYSNNNHQTRKGYMKVIGAKWTGRGETFFHAWKHQTPSRHE